MKFKSMITVGLLALSTMLTGCFGFVEDGTTGVRNQFGKVHLQEEGPGFTTWFTSSLDIYTVKETAIQLNNMTPKAGDNLSLREMDVTVYYRVEPSMIADLSLKYKGQSWCDKRGLCMAGYNLVNRQAQAVIQDEVSKHQSLTIHTKRNAIEDSVKQALQASLDETDKGAFFVTRVAVTKVLTDASIEQSIRNVVQAQKDNEAMDYRLQVASKQAQLNEKLNQTYTAAYLQHEYNVAMQKCAENPGCTMIIGEAKPLINLR